jgi:hypothetical protein
MRCGARRLLLGLTMLLPLPGAAQAQEGFLFRQPAATISLRFGGAVPLLGGALFGDMRDELTLERSDFLTEAFAADLMIHVNPQFDVGAAFQWSQSATDSEYRDLVYENDDPIRQTTKLRRVPLTAQLRYYPIPRGESVAEFAWVPARFTPFVGAGLGMLWYRLEQEGDFVERGTNDIFSNSYESSGSGLAAQLLAGADYWVVPAIGLTAEARYTYSSDAPSGDYRYSSIDLSGLQFSAGFSLRF